MSIYSGFATRNLQQVYDQLVYELILIFSKRILKFYTNEAADDLKFRNLVRQLFIKLVNMQKRKYLQPNMSKAVEEMMRYILEGRKENQESKSSEKQKLWVKINRKNEQQNSKRLEKTIERKQREIKEAWKQKKTMNPQLSLRTRRERVNKEDEKYEILYTPSLKGEINKKSRNILKEKDDYEALKQKISSRGKWRDQLEQFNKGHKSQRNVQTHVLHQTSYSPKHFNKKFQPPSKISHPQICPCCQIHQNMHPNSPTNFIPQIFNSYIHSTNHQHMKHFRKRKIIPQSLIF